MNLINIDFDREKNDIKWNIIVLIFSILFLVSLILLIIFGEIFDNIQNENKENNHSENSQKITENNCFPNNYNKKNYGQEEKTKIEDIPLKGKDEGIIKEKSNSNLAKSDREINEDEKMTENITPPLELKDGKELINVIFQSSNEIEVNCHILCKKNFIFNQVEKLFYEKFPKFKEAKNIFLCNGKPVDKMKTLEENDIKDQQIIMLSNEPNILKDN